MRYALAWMVLALAVSVGIGSLNWLSYRRLSTRGLAGQATVVELLPKDHNSVRYEYPVGSKVFQGRMQSWPPNPPLEDLVVGKTLTVYFDPERPEVSVLGDPKKMLTNETISVGLASILFPSFIVSAWMWMTSRRHRPRGAAFQTADRPIS